MNIHITPRFASFLTLGLLTVIGIFLVLRSTPEGLGLSDDSIAYIAGARSLLAGHGYREAWLASNNLMTHFPPGFSSALAVIGLLGLDPLRGARFLNAILFGFSTALIGILGLAHDEVIGGGTCARWIVRIEWFVASSLYDSHERASLYLFESACVLDVRSIFRA